MIDEAQNLSRTVLEELRMLTGIETEKEKIVTILLLGQPELDRKLNDPAMDQLRQRARLRLNIGALSKDETQAYILHRLQVAGCKRDDLFDSDAIAAVVEASGGVPRLINTLCDTALTACLVMDEKQVTGMIIKTVLDELNWTDKSHADRLTETAPHLDRVALQLEIEDNGQLIATHVITESGCVIGRASDCGITVENKFLSHHHAMFNREGALWQVSDLNSTNGTILNHKKIHNSTLEDFDVIDMGTCRIRCRLLRLDETETTGRHDVAGEKDADSSDKPRKKRRGKSKIQVVK
jgi:hypothetical protein